MAIIGAGRVGTALGVLLERAGYRVVSASGREASRERVERHLPRTAFLPAREAAGRAEVVILGVTDDLIGPVCEEIAPALEPGRFVAHLSGSLGLDPLAPAEAVGAEVLSLHPLQSFPDVDEGVRRLPGSGIAVTARTKGGWSFGERAAVHVGGIPFRLAEEVKPLYHSAAVFCANYLVTVEAVAERLMLAAGIASPLPLLSPLARTAFDRTFELGPGAALTGPAVRGDVGTIERNLRALDEGAPEAVGPYAALARVAALVAEAAGRLSPEDRRRVEEALAPWS